MAKRLPPPPGVADDRNFRALERWHKELEDQLRLVGSRTIDLGSIAAGGGTTFTMTVPGARAGVGQTVQLGLPSAWPGGLLAQGVVTGDDEVTVSVRNVTGGAIDPAAATYYARVMP